MTHTVKTWIKYFKEQIDEVKQFELRKDDRNYKVNDKFISQEFDEIKNEYTGREIIFTIIYILKDAEQFGLKEGHCILGLRYEY